MAACDRVDTPSCPLAAFSVADNVAAGACGGVDRWPGDHRLADLGRRSSLPVIRALCVAYIELVRGVPLISLLFMASVMLPLFLPGGMRIDKLARAQLALILFAAAYLAEVVRGGLQAIPRGQYDAAAAMGLGYWGAMRGVILPQALRIAVPPLVNTFVGF